MAAAEGGSPAYGAFANAIELAGDNRDQAPEWIQLFPEGPDLATVNYDGRSWVMSDPAAVAAASTEDGLQLPIDFDHSTAKAGESETPLPTAGWIREIELRGGVLMGRVEWTAEGAEALESKRYKYFSPYFLSAKGNDGGEVWRVLHGALTKTPAFNMPALASARRQEAKPMKKVLAALGLAESADEEQAAAAVEALKTPSLDRFVPRADYDAEKARADAAEGKVADAAASALAARAKAALDAAQEAGKITPATRAYHEAQCKTEDGLKRFEEFAAAAPEIAAPSGISGDPPTGAKGFASAEEGQIAKAFRRDAAFLDKHAPRGEGGND